MYMHLHIPLSSHDSLPPSLPPSLRRRAGHNGQQSSAVLCEEFRSEKKKNISKDMLEYCIQGKSCRRALFTLILTLMSLIVLGCSCCDVCAKSCMCIDCKCNSFPICLK